MLRTRIGVLAIAGVTMLAAASRAVATPRLEAAERTYDAGRVDQGTVLRHTFVLRNVGDADLTVDAVPGCSCTVAAFDKVIAAGASGTLVATLDTVHEHGVISKDVRVATNDPAAVGVLLHLRADVVPAFRVSPTEHPIIRGKPPDLRPVEVVVASTDGAPFEVRDVTADPALTVGVTPAAPGRYTVTIAAKPDVVVGRSQRFVTLATSHPRVPSVAIGVNLDVRSSVDVAPARLVLRPGADAQHVVLRRQDGGPWNVTGVVSSDADVFASLATVTEGRVYDVTVRYVGTGKRGVVRAAVTVATDDPAERAIVIPVTARR